jgi:hypothetical protein
MLLPSPAMIPDKMGIIGSTHGVNVSSKPKPKKAAITKIKLPSNRRAISKSLAKIDSDGVVLPEVGASAAARRSEAFDSIGT